jgi:hypothetical protein
METRAQYGMKTGYRLLPRQFGDYGGVKIFEIEEVCVETNTMSFDEYLECRGLCLILKLFSFSQFDTIGRHLREAKIDRFEFIEAVTHKIASGKVGELSEIYADFVSDTRTELFASPEEMTAFYSREENYQGLLSGQLGDNLLRRHSARMLFNQEGLAIQVAYRVLGRLLCKHGADPLAIEALGEACRWVMATRDVYAAIHLSPSAFEPAALTLSFDVPGWYAADPDCVEPLAGMGRTTSLSLGRDQPETARLVEIYTKMYGGTPVFWAAKMIDSMDISVLWRSPRG